jgi:hypothetical protein
VTAFGSDIWILDSSLLSHYHLSSSYTPLPTADADRCTEQAVIFRYLLPGLATYITIIRNQRIKINAISFTSSGFNKSGTRNAEYCKLYGAAE